MTLIGVSLPVPDPHARELQDYRVGLGEPEADGIPTHVTLVPPTEVPGRDLTEVCDHLRRAAAGHRPFSVHLRGTGTFRPVSPVVFLNLVEGISECELLADSVRSGPLRCELDFPYHPHVTVAHHAEPGYEDSLDRAFADLADYELTFAVGSFWLYVHDEHAGWVTEHEFRLGQECLA